VNVAAASARCSFYFSKPQPVLLALPCLEGQALPNHASSPCRGREDIRRLRRRHNGGNRPLTGEVHTARSSSSPWVLPATPTPRRPGRNRSPTRLAHTTAPSATSAECPDRSCRSSAASKHACTIPRLTGPMPTWRLITTPRHTGATAQVSRQGESRVRRPYARTQQSPTHHRERTYALVTPALRQLDPGPHRT
jgi:hypothetical protein